MGFLFILIYFVLILFVVEIAVTAMIFTGLEPEISRFQVVSMLTSTGFTTKESELILRHPIRRRIAIFLILFGVFSLAVIISTISSMMAQSFGIPQLAGVTAVFGLLLIAVKNRRIGRRLGQWFSRHLEQDFEPHELPLHETLYVSEHDLFAEIQICPKSGFIGKRVDELIGPDEDAAILLVQRGTHKIRSGRLKLNVQEGDTLFVYGDKLQIERRFAQELKEKKAEELDERQVASML